MSAEESALAAETQVCAAALPVLVRHIDTARAQAETAVLALNAHFMTAMKQLQEMSSLATAVHDGGAATFERIDEEFMVMSETQAALTRQYGDLAAKSAALAPALSGLLALARQVGTPPLVEKVEQIATVMFEVMEAHGKLNEDAKHSAQRIDRRVDAAMAPYGEALSKLAQYGDGMRAELGECLVQLQFQDRISQILGHAVSSMTLLGQYLAGAAPQCPLPQSCSEFLDQMSGGYTTEEQHRDHELALAEARAAPAGRGCDK